MPRRISFDRPRLRRPEVRSSGQVQITDFVFVVLDDDASRWQRAKYWLLFRLGVLRPPK